MGDRVDLTVYVPPGLEKEAIKALEGSGIFETFPGTSGYIVIPEVNYAEYSPYMEQLRQAGIACTIEWHEGHEYSAGVAHLRFDEKGDPVYEEISDSEYYLNPKKMLEQLQRKSLEEIRADLQSLVDRKNCKVELDQNQVLNGKKHLLNLALVS